jgi:hypothetical protein
MQQRARAARMITDQYSAAATTYELPVFFGPANRL